VAVKAVEKGAVAAREGEKVVIGLVNLVIHRVEAEETTHHPRSKVEAHPIAIYR